MRSASACLLLSLWTSVACGDTPKPPPRPITQADSVLAVYREDSGFASTGTATLVLAIWPNGSVVWSEDRLGGGASYRTGTVDPKKVTALLSAFEKDGFFADKVLSRRRYNSHMPFLTVFVKLGEKQLKMQSWHELGEATGNLVGTGLGPSWLEGRRLDVLRKQSAEYLYFRFIWSETRDKLAGLIPRDSKPIAGVLVRHRDSWSWQEEPARPHPGAAPPPGLDKLLETYREFGLPLPPAEAKLVHFEHDRGSGWWSEVGFYISTRTALGFLLKPGVEKQSSVVLVGTEEHEAWYGIKAVEADRKLALSVELVPWGSSVFGMNTGLATAMQCKARGWDELAQALFDASLKKSAGHNWDNMFSLRANLPPETALAYLAWTYWANQLTKSELDRTTILKRMRQVLAAEPTLGTERNQLFLRCLQAADEPSKAKPGSIEALVDDLVNLGHSDGGWGHNWDPRYLRIVDLGFDAVPTLINHLDDDRLTRAVWGGMNNAPPRFYHVCEIASELLRYLAVDDLPNDQRRGLSALSTAKDTARRWWEKVSKEGEEAYLLRNILPKPGNKWPNSRLLRIIKVKYPRHLVKVYQTILTDRPEMESSYVAEAVRTSSLPREKKVELFRRAAAHEREKIRAVAISSLKELGVEP